MSVPDADDANKVGQGDALGRDDRRPSIQPVDAADGEVGLVHDEPADVFAGTDEDGVAGSAGVDGRWTEAYGLSPPTT